MQIERRSLILLSIVILPLVWLIRNRFQKGLHKLPGPLLNSLSVIPRLRSVYSGVSQDDDIALHLKYGKIVRVAPHVVSISDPAMFDQIYGISSKFFKSGFYEGVRFYDKEGIIPGPFVLADREMHSRMKRNASNAYSLQGLVRLEPLVDMVIERLVQRIDGYALSGNVCDIGQYMLFFSMDAVFMVTFGQDLDFINKGDERKLLMHLQDGLLYMICIGQIPWAHKFLLGNSWVEKLLSYFGGGSSIMDEVMDIAIRQRAVVEKQIAAENDDETKPATFLIQLLRNQMKNPSSITDREINSHTFGNIIAGGDTTATALRGIIRNIARNPEIGRRIREELFNAGITAGSKPVPYAVASKLPYLAAVIKESMRLHPSVGMMLARGVPRGGVVLRSSDGQEYSFGPGTEVGINPWIIHRNPDIFTDPDSFAPERWLDATSEKLSQMNKFWIPFGAGRHSCSGHHISMLEMTKLIPTLVLRYDITWAEGTPDVDIKNYFFTLQSGLHINLKRRG